ncbi:hypothetical protein ACQEVS_06990 [Streptomyces sp. CA-181903]|uniref:hypothetical protein n=1 Tax=Streptomyces sp. CA-181903 TaxID=3240055 RepID=UPI003D8BEAC4
MSEEVVSGEAGDGVSPADVAGGVGEGVGEGAEAGETQGSGEVTGAAETGEPAGPRPLGVDRTPTGHPGVDTHLARLADADHLAADGHLAVYEDVHQGLRSALAALDERPDRPPVPTRPYDNRS